MTDSPFTKTDLAKIKEALFKLNGAQQWLQLLQKIGQDVTELEKQMSFYNEVLTTLRTELFPNQ